MPAGIGVGELVEVVDHLLKGLGADLLELDAAVDAAAGDLLLEELRQPLRCLLRDLERLPVRAFQGDHVPAGHLLRRRGRSLVHLHHRSLLHRHRSPWASASLKDETLASLSRSQG
jgi:hypothetical protein